MAGSRKNKGKKRGGCWGGKTMRGGNMYGVGQAIVPGAIEYKPVPNLSANSATGQLGPADTGAIPKTGGRRKTMKVKDIKKILKKNGISTKGRKSTLLRKMKKARIMKGGSYAGMIPLPTANSGFTGQGAIRGMGGYQDVNTGGQINNVVELK